MVQVTSRTEGLASQVEMGNTGWLLVAVKASPLPMGLHPVARMDKGYKCTAQPQSEGGALHAEKKLRLSVM